MATEFELTPIVKHGSPADALMDDPVVPPVRMENEPSGSASVVHSFGNALPLPTLDTGTPGSLSQFRGLGRSAEDINVQTLGVPLNPPQGGGLNFAVFPFFLWSDFLYQQAPSLGAFDPRGVSGSVVLIPWSAGALRLERSAAGGGAFYSDAGLGQFWASAKGGWQGGAAALTLGDSVGKSKGPSGSLSARQILGASTAYFHLIATDIDAESPGTEAFPTPLARFRTQRWIPILQLDAPIAQEGLLKSSVYFDGSILKYNDPASGFVTQDRISQAGLEDAFLTGAWRFGLSGRSTHYEKLDSIPPDEYALNLLSTYSYENNGWLIEPTLLGTAVSRFGLLPAGSLGVRREIDGKNRALFSRISFSRRFPSLQDRYYQVPFFIGNPDLEPERDWTMIVGWESRTGKWKQVFQLYGQLRENSQVTSADASGALRPNNSGQARVGSFMSRIEWEAGAGLALSNSLSLNTSKLSATDQSFPYLPTVLDVLSLGYERPRWAANVIFRVSDSAETGSPGAEVAGYGTWDISARYEVVRRVWAAARVDNVGDRHYGTVAGDLNRGRTLIVQLSGEL